MSGSKIAQAFAQAFDGHDIESLAQCLSEDFVFEGVFPQPLGKDAYLNFMRAIFKAFPDFSLNRKILPSPEDHVLRELVQVTGTHTGDLDLPFPGWSRVPPTGTIIALPAEPVDVVFRGDKVISIRAYEASGGDLVGILSHLGLDLPE